MTLYDLAKLCNDLVAADPIAAKAKFIHCGNNDDLVIGLEELPNSTLFVQGREIDHYKECPNCGTEAVTSGCYWMCERHGCCEHGLIERGYLVIGYNKEKQP